MQVDKNAEPENAVPQTAGPVFSVCGQLGDKPTGRHISVNWATMFSLI